MAFGIVIYHSINLLNKLSTADIRTHMLDMFAKFHYLVSFIRYVIFFCSADYITLKELKLLEVLKHFFQIFTVFKLFMLTSKALVRK